MSEDESKQPPKHLWKNLKTEKNKYIKQQDTHQNPKAFQNNHNLDQALEEAPVKFQDNAMSGDQFAKAIKQAIKPEGEKHRGLFTNGGLTMEIKIKSEPDQKMPPHQEFIFCRVASESQEIGQYLDIPVENMEFDASQQEEEDPMIISNGTTVNNTISLTAAKRRMRNAIRSTRDQCINIAGFIEKQKETYLQFLQGMSQMVISKFSQILLTTTDTAELVEELRQKQQMIEVLEKENNYLQCEIKLKSHVKPQREEQFQMQLEDQIRRIQKLQNTIKDLTEENEQMSESIFDFQQKIAQLDLQIEKRVDREVRKRMEKENQKDCRELQMPEIKEQNTEKHPQFSQDRDYYINQMANMEKEIQKMSENYLRQEEEFAFLKQQLLERQDEVLAREDQLAISEREIQSAIKQIDVKRIQMDNKMDNIRRKEYELQTIEKQLSKRESELDEKTRIQIQKQMEPRSVPTIRAQMENAAEKIVYHVDEKVYGLRENHGESSHHQTSYGKRQKTMTQNFQRMPRYEQGIRRSSKSGQKSITFELQNSRSRGYKSPPAVFTGSVASKSGYNKSKSNVDSTRLHDLGSKLERLREQIRKEIRDAV